jgi:hypothetical protein
MYSWIPCDPRSTLGTTGLGCSPRFFKHEIHTLCSSQCSLPQCMIYCHKCLWTDGRSPSHVLYVAPLLLPDGTCVHLTLSSFPVSLPFSLGQIMTSAVSEDFCLPFNTLFPRDLAGDRCSQRRGVRGEGNSDTSAIWKEAIYIWWNTKSVHFTIFCLSFSFSALLR